MPGRSGAKTALTAAALLAAGCPGSLGDTSRFTAACPTDIQTAIFVPRCATAGCHSTGDHVASLDLQSPDVDARLVGKPATGGDGLLIDPLYTDGSVLIRKLTPAPPFGEQQPPGAPLDTFTLDCIRAWARTCDADGGTCR
jgi:hypothetical protein